MAGVRSADDEDESSVIKCVCGYQDDDGSTVLCEECNSWQHIECYYPDTDVPEVHECVDCDPRPLDSDAAAERQRRLREDRSSTDRKTKRSQQKTQRKKPTGATTSSSNGATTPNSRPGPDRKHSSSPKPEGPSATKKVKTGHRPSSSVPAAPTPPAVPSQAKRRSIAGGSGSKTAGTPDQVTLDLYSFEFLNLHRQAEFRPVEVNTYTDLGITNSLHEWLLNPEALSQTTNGLARDTVFATVTRFDDLERTAPSVEKRAVEDKETIVHGEHPVLQWITVSRSVLENAFIGELKGQIGRKADYHVNPDNRWDSLRHPEPFVFFPPFLPIYIDSRIEGCVLRYVRRSCRPNLKMQILIEDSTYHFCFVSTRPIEAGEELTIAWDIDETAREILSKSVSNGNARKEGIHGADDEYLSCWVTAILANFGGCACSKAHGVCWLDRFDRRNQGSREGPSSVKSSSTSSVGRAKKAKKTASDQPSSGGHLPTSPEWGERAAPDPNPDSTETGSGAESPREKIVSRTMSPAEACQQDASQQTFGIDLSSRELRKLKQSERLFQQQAGRKKRLSGLSRNGDKPNSPLSQPRSKNGRQSRSRPVSAAMVKPRFVDAGVQTDPISVMSQRSFPYRPVEKEQRSKLPLQTPRWRLYHFWKGREMFLVNPAEQSVGGRSTSPIPKPKEQVVCEPAAVESDGREGRTDTRADSMQDDQSKAGDDAREDVEMEDVSTVEQDDVTDTSGGAQVKQSGNTVETESDGRPADPGIETNAKIPPDDSARPVSPDHDMAGQEELEDVEMADASAGVATGLAGPEDRPADSVEARTGDEVANSPLCQSPSVKAEEDVPAEAELPARDDMRSHSPSVDRSSQVAERPVQVLRPPTPPESIRPDSDLDHQSRTEVGSKPDRLVHSDGGSSATPLTVATTTPTETKDCRPNPPTRPAVPLANSPPSVDDKQAVVPDPARTVKLEPVSAEPVDGEVPTTVLVKTEPSGMGVDKAEALMAASPPRQVVPMSPVAMSPPAAGVVTSPTGWTGPETNNRTVTVSVPATGLGNGLLAALPSPAGPVKKKKLTLSDYTSRKKKIEARTVVGGRVEPASPAEKTNGPNKPTEAGTDAGAENGTTPS